MVRCGRTVVVEWHSRRNNRLRMDQWELGIRAVHQSDAAPVLIIVSASLERMTLPLLDFLRYSSYSLNCNGVVFLGSVTFDI